MNRLNYFLVLFVTLFILLSLFTTPQSFKSYLKSEINTTIPEEFEVAKPIKLTKIPFDIDAFSEAKENNAIESINLSHHPMRFRILSFLYYFLL